MILPAVFLLSASAIALEILLARVFSITQWNHLSFMVISIALFGFAVSGAALNLMEARRPGSAARLTTEPAIRRLVVLFCVSGIAAAAGITRLPLDYFRLPVEPVQSLYLLAAYLLPAVPFFFAGLITALAYAARPETSGRVYFASMAGSAAGALLPALLLPVWGEERLILICIAFPLAALGYGGRSDPARRGRRAAIRLSAIAGAGIAIGTILTVPAVSRLVRIAPSPYKGLSQILQFPDSHITRTRHSLQGRIDRIRSPYVRFAPGLSLKFSGKLPVQHPSFCDGDNPLVRYSIRHPDDLDFCRFTTSHAAYTLTGTPASVLVIQNGGGLAIPCAMAAGAGEITVIEANPILAGMLRAHYDLPVIRDAPRAYLARTDRRFTVIHLENWGASMAGAAALNQDHTFTTEAMDACLSRLSDRGVLLITRRLLLPPADSIRLFATAYEALAGRGVDQPENHLAMLRNWDTFTLIVSARPMENADRLKRFARERNFDPVFLPHIKPDTANRFNVFDRPFHYRAIQGLLAGYQSGTARAFFRTYPLDVAPQSDQRPFPGRFLKWSRLPELHRSTGGRLYSLLMSGEIVVAAVFVEAFAVAGILLLLPRWARNRVNQPPGGGRFRLFFLAVGAGFMFVELYFIKSYTLLFGDPVISFAVVLTGILIFSSIGGLCSQRLGRRGLVPSLLALMLCLVLLAAGLPPLISRVLRFAEPLRFFIGLMLLLPPGILLGLPFPLGMRLLPGSAEHRAEAWTANGCTSVLTSILSAQIALTLGIRAILISGFLAYAAALLGAVQWKVNGETGGQ